MAEIHDRGRDHEHEAAELAFRSVQRPEDSQHFKDAFNKLLESDWWRKPTRHNLGLEPYLKGEAGGDSSATPPPRAIDILQRGDAQSPRRTSSPAF